MKHLHIVARASNDIKDLIGQGMEYLVDKDNNVIAVFSEGNMLGHTYEKGTVTQAEAITKVSA